jgi:hypothetical protein
VALGRNEQIRIGSAPFSMHLGESQAKGQARRSLIAIRSNPILAGVTPSHNDISAVGCQVEGIRGGAADPAHDTAATRPAMDAVAGLSSLIQFCLAAMSSYVFDFKQFVRKAHLSFNLSSLSSKVQE